MKTLNTLTSKTSNFEKKVMYAWNTQFGIEVGTRTEWLRDMYSMPGCIKFISKHVDMFVGTQHERELYIRNAVIEKLNEKGLVIYSKTTDEPFLKTNKTIEL